jgi:hypothetical protein
MMPEAEVVMQCRHCSNKSTFKKQGEYIHKDYEYAYDPDEERSYETECSTIIWRLMKCSTCSKPTLEATYQWCEIYHASEDEKLHGYLHMDGAEVNCMDPATEILYPTLLPIIMPPDDMPEDVAEVYNEARKVVVDSPRSSAALMRLAIQMLCKHLGQPGKNLNEDIAALVKKGLDPWVQKALDTVRVVGNNAVHPGEINLKDDQKITLMIFDLTNFIVKEMITRPRERDEIYSKLPQRDLENIEKRDGSKQKMK